MHKYRWKNVTADSLRRYILSFIKKTESYLSSHSSSGFPSKKSRTFDRYRNLNWRCRGMKILNESRKRTVCKSTQRPQTCSISDCPAHATVIRPTLIEEVGAWRGKKQKRNEWRINSAVDSVIRWVWVSFVWFSEVSHFSCLDFREWWMESWTLKFEECMEHCHFWIRIWNWNGVSLFLEILISGSPVLGKNWYRRIVYKVFVMMLLAKSVWCCWNVLLFLSENNLKIRMHN